MGGSAGRARSATEGEEKGNLARGKNGRIVQYLKVVQPERIRPVGRWARLHWRGGCRRRRRRG